MTFKEAMDLSIEQFRHITQKELKKRMVVLTNTANKRLTRLQKAGIESPATKYEKFSIRDKDFNALKKEFSRVRNFLNLKSSTVRGAKLIYKEFKTRLNQESDIDVKEFWKAYNKIKQTDKALISRLSSSQVQSQIYNMMIDGNDVDKIIKEILSPERYEESVEEEINPFELLDEDLF